jgi:molybdenum-dependent DNA-binding transcriptional regulator ModE
MAAAIGETFGVTLMQMRQKGKDRGITHGRKLLSLVAHEYSYRGREIAEYIQKDPALITRYIKEKEELKKDAERIIAAMIDRKVKCQ